MNKMKIPTIIIISILLVILVGSFALAKTMGEVKYLDSEGKIKISTLKELFGGFSNVYCVEHYQRMSGGTYSKMATIEIDGKYTKITVPGQAEPIFEGNNSYSNKIAAAVHLDTLEDIENYDGLWNSGRWYSAGQLVVWELWGSWRNELNDAAKNIIKPCTQDSTYNQTILNNAVKVVEEYAAENTYKATIHYLGISPEDSSSQQSTSQKLILVEETIAPPKVDIPVKKVWVDDEDRDGIRPDSIQVKLLANGEEVKDSKGNLLTITLNDKNNWRGEFTGLDEQDSEGKNIVYTVEEVGEKSGYIISYGEDTTTDPVTKIITNTHEPEKVRFEIVKDWQDDDNRDGLRDNEVQVKFFANDTLINTIKLNESNNWKYETGELDKYSDGKEINYEFDEITVEGYEDSINITKVSTTEGVTTYKVTVVNKHTPEVIEIPVEKDWDDDNDRDGKRPTEIEVTLKYANGEKVTTDASGNQIENPVKLNESNGWKHIFTNLNKYENQGKLIQYNIEETPIEDERKYEEPVINGDKTTGYIITNTHVPERTKIKVVKEWNDMDDLDEYRPDSITLKLLANGQPAQNDKGEDVSTIVLNAPNEFANTWEYVVTDLFKYENGEEIQYTIVEENVPEHYVKGEMQKEVSTDETGMQIITLKITNTHEPNYDGYIEITGKVWLDRPDGKGNNINGIMDEDENGLSGKKVTLRDSQGNQFDVTSTTTTGKDGTYIIRVNYDNSKDVYKLYDDVDTVRTKLKTAYVEFEYDGMKYTTVATATTGADTSKAKEDESKRNQFDAAHDTVVPENLDDPNTQHPDKWTDKDMIAKTEGVISFENYSDKTTETRKEVLKYCYGNGTYIRTNPEGAWNEILPGTNAYLACTSGNGHKITEYDINVEIIQNVNLGLFEREQPDVAIFSDLSKVVVTMNGQQYTYLYNVRSNENNNVGLQVKFENKDTYTYRRPVNPADIAYVNQEGNGNAMTVEVTYEVRVGNLSTTLPMTVHNIINSYDSRYTLKNEGWTSTPGSQFSQAKYNGDLNIKLEPLTESDVIELTYSVSAEAIKSLLNEEATLNNAVEIESFSTAYGANTLYAEQRTGGRTNQPYAGYDYDSHPGNAGISINNEGRLEAKYPEDDTDIAPSFVLCKDSDTTPNDPSNELRYKVLSGNIWEDSDFNTEDNERLGDGNKGRDEKNLENVKVELYKVNNDNTISEEPATLYKVNDDGSISEKSAVTFSDEHGNYSFGNNGVDRYIIKFTYGEGIDGTKTSSINGLNVNARNYKSTIISSNDENKVLYDIFKNGTIDDEWHLKTQKGYSIALDDMQKRIAIEDLQYSNFSDAIFMTAYSKPFKMQVEFDDSSEKTSSVGADGETTFDNELNIFDFGIIERAREDIFVEKTIDFVKVTLANGQVLIEGNPNDTATQLNYVKGIGFGREINTGKQARESLAKRMVIEIDAELIQQAQLNMRYLITVTNNSEVDYDYYVDGQIKTEYYYFGTNSENSPKITSSVNKLIDYIDTDYNFNWEYSDNWKETTVAELTVDGEELVSEATANSFNRYKAYTTEMFSEVGPGESKSDYAFASKLLANKDENRYENHIEILQIDAKTARTTGADEDKNTIQKQYKPGNYIPSLDKRVKNDNVNNEQPGLHEQDDDRVEVVITPPTGATKYITIYIIAGLAGLIVISLGVIFIKKKVLTK